jgi:hypothetical protein
LTPASTPSAAVAGQSRFHGNERRNSPGHDGRDHIIGPVAAEHGIFEASDVAGRLGSDELQADDHLCDSAPTGCDVRSNTPNIVDTSSARGFNEYDRVRYAPLPVSSHVMHVDAFDATNATGNMLSQQQGTLTVAIDTANRFSMTLDAVPGRDIYATTDASSTVEYNSAGLNHHLGSEYSSDIVLDATGHIYIANEGNGTGDQIRIDRRNAGPHDQRPERLPRARARRLQGTSTYRTTETAQ